MSDAVMLLATAAANPAPPAPAAHSHSRRAAEGAHAKIDPAMPGTAAKANEKESAETAAQFSEILATVASEAQAVKNQPVSQAIVDADLEVSLLDPAAGEKALSFWNFEPKNQATSESAKVGDAVADEFIKQAANALNAAKAQPQSATDAMPTQLTELEQTFDLEALAAKAKLATTTPAAQEKGTENAAETTPQAAPKADVQAELKLPNEVRVVTNTTKEATDGQAAKEPVVTTPSVVQKPANQGDVKTPETVQPSQTGRATETSQEVQASAVRVPMPKETVKSEAKVEATSVRPNTAKKGDVAVKAVDADQIPLKDSKVSVKGSDEMAEGQFGTLRPATSAPRRSAAERQGLPEEKAETVGKDFSEAQRTISTHATESRENENVGKISEQKTAPASPATQVAEAAKTAQRKGVRVLEIELKPEGLGTLRLKLTGPVRGPMGEGQQIEIQALNPKAHALLLEHLTELRGALGQWEIRLMPALNQQNGVMAGSESRGYGQQGSQRQDGQQGQQERRSPQQDSGSDFAEQFRSSTNS